MSLQSIGHSIAEKAKSFGNTVADTAPVVVDKTKNIASRAFTATAEFFKATPAFISTHSKLFTIIGAAVGLAVLVAVIAKVVIGKKSTPADGEGITAPLTTEAAPEETPDSKAI
ncbi:MAG TPA: hypothetical protein P5048_02185 [Chlamydiales bacterium]|nr:hypothetical protein [Chlamydiales bacterium]